MGLETGPGKSGEKSVEKPQTILSGEVRDRPLSPADLVRELRKSAAFGQLSPETRRSIQETLRMSSETVGEIRETPEISYDFSGEVRDRPLSPVNLVRELQKSAAFGQLSPETRRSIQETIRMSSETGGGIRETSEISHEITQQITRRIEDAPRVLGSIRSHLSNARTADSPGKEKEALGQAGDESCSYLSDFLTDDQLWHVLHWNHASGGSQLSIDWTAALDALDVRATTELLWKLGLDQEEAKQLVTDARDLLREAAARGTALSPFWLISAANRTMSKLQQEICSRTDELTDELRTVAGRRRLMAALGMATKPLAIAAGLALAIPGVGQEAAAAAPQVKIALEQAGGAVGQALAVFGPAVILEQASATIDTLKAPLERFKSQRKWEPLGRPPIGSVDDRLRALQERIDSARDAPTVTVLANPVGCRVVLESTAPGKEGKHATEYEIFEIVTPVGVREPDPPTAPTEFRLLSPVGEKQPEVRYRLLGRQEDTDFGTFTAPAGPLTECHLERADGSSPGLYGFKPISTGSSPFGTPKRRAGPVDPAGGKRKR